MPSRRQAMTGFQLLWTPNLPYQIPAAVLQILPLVANLWGCRWDKFVLFIFHFRLLFTLFVLFECLCLRAKVCWVLYWNKCARHAGSGQCFRPALFWRHHTRLVGSPISGLSWHVTVVICHWFVSATPVKYRVEFKTLLIIIKGLHGKAPSYI